jgi:hypothetical protein
MLHVNEGLEASVRFLIGENQYRPPDRRTVREESEDL